MNAVRYFLLLCCMLATLCHITGLLVGQIFSIIQRNPEWMVSVGGRLAPRVMVYAEGYQIYYCQPSTATYVFLRTESRLYNSAAKTAFVGLHYFRANPDFSGGRRTWYFFDGSFVTSVRRTAFQSPQGFGSVSWMLTQRTSSSGFGILGQTSFVMRVDTNGGFAPRVGACVPNTAVGVPYSAIYMFQ